MIQKRRVAVVGTGSVGVAAAYSLFLRRTASELLLVDKDVAKAEGHAMDLMHGQALVGHVQVRSARLDELGDAQVVVVTAGKSQKRGETRLDLLRRNAEVIREVIADLDRHAPEALIVIATNPVDILTWLAQNSSSRSSGLVIGTGTTLDSARFRMLVADAFGVSPRSVHGYVLGEHGDSQVAVWSQTAIGGMRLDDGPIEGHLLDATARKQIADATRNAAREIIERKGHTDLAIGTVIGHLVEAALTDERAVQPLSVTLDGEYGLRDVCLSIPCVLGRDGVVARITPKLSDVELEALHASARVLRAAAEDAGLSAT
ncbi:MAG TPA: L-lactate dehydrogenase [Labilithrix sp.]|nr:L-lactate dehydrogenase [Labilithrix sp.]